MFELLDHYLGYPAQDWPAKFQAYRASRLAKAAGQVDARAAAPAKVGPSENLDAYVGTFKDDWYGDIVVGRDGDHLTIDFKTTPRMSGPLEHWQYDSFTTRFTDKTIEPAFVTFAMDLNGHVAHVTLKPVSPTADFSFDYQDLDFTPVAAK